MKQRIMSPAQIARAALIDGDYQGREQAHKDMMMHMCASWPNSEVRVYIDRDMGGWVVELPE